MKPKSDRSIWFFFKRKITYLAGWCFEKINQFISLSQKNGNYSLEDEMLKRNRVFSSSELALETMEKNVIQNYFVSLIVAGDSTLAGNTARKYLKQHPGLTVRCRIDLSFNCHGLTFGTRRTQIYSSNVVRKILEEDKYEEVGVSECLPGDIIIYWVENSAEHSGIVVSEPNELGVPWIVSKWGVSGPEVIHAAPNSPYGPNYIFYRKKALC